MLSFIHPLLPHINFAAQICIILILVIMIHELGHLWGAKKYRCKVKVFSIGFGKPFFSFRKGETIYQISWVLLGGYCSLDGELDYSKKKRAFTNLPYMQKSCIALSGILANCITGLMSLGLGVLFNWVPFYNFGYLSIVLGLSNLIPFPALDGSYPLLFLLEKKFGKKDGIILMQRAVNAGMFFINLLNIFCILYLGNLFVRWSLERIGKML